MLNYILWAAVVWHRVVCWEGTEAFKGRTSLKCPCATNWKVAGKIPDCFIEIFHWHNPSGRTMALGLTQPLTEMSTRNIPWGVKAAGCQGWQPYHLHVPIVLKCGSFKLLETSGPSRPVMGLNLPLPPWCVGRDSSVGIATRYGLDGPRIESRCGSVFLHPSIPARGATGLLCNRSILVYITGVKAAGIWLWPSTPSKCGG
jgi:hypothetical protein